MSSLKGELIYFFLRTFNYIIDSFNYYKEQFNGMIELYNNKNKDNWVLMMNINPAVLPLSSIKNVQLDNKWVYEPSSNKLVYSNSTNKVKVSWLSAELARFIKIDLQNPETNVLSLDNFLESFQLYTDAEHAPTLQHIVYCINIKHKLWFGTEDTVKLSIIDNMGDTVEFYSTEFDKQLSINRRNELC